MRTKILCLILSFISFEVEAADKVKTPAVEEQSEIFCREARKLSSELCRDSKNSCDIKTDAQYEEALKQLKNAPVSSSMAHTAEIKELLKKTPTKDGIADLLAKIGGDNTCEVGTYYRLASSVGRYKLAKTAKSAEAARSVIKDWLKKDMTAEYPTFLSLMVRTKVASEYVASNVVSVSADAKKELDEMVSGLQNERKKFAMTTEDGKDTSSDWSPKKWQDKLKEEFTVTKKYSGRWLKWVEASWK